MDSAGDEAPALSFARSPDMPRAVSLKNIVARGIGIAVVIALLGFYPSYLASLHSMCGVIKDKVVRYL
jgi:energy-converting hydrogenase Eha subunit A